MQLSICSHACYCKAPSVIAHQPVSFPSINVQDRLAAGWIDTDDHAPALQAHRAACRRLATSLRLKDEPWLKSGPGDRCTTLKVRRRMASARTAHRWRGDLLLASCRGAWAATNGLAIRGIPLPARASSDTSPETMIPASLPTKQTFSLPLARL